MWSIGELISEKSGFIGVISSYIAENELNLFKEYIKNNFAYDGGLIYICSSAIKEQCLEFLDGLDSDFKKLININRLVIISREDYLGENGIDVDSIVDRMESEIARLSEIDMNRKTCVYINVDSYWNSVSIHRIKRTYKRLRELYNTGKANYLIRYMVEDMDKTHIFPMLQYHDYLVIDGVDSFDVYTPEELIQKGLVLLSQRRSVDFKYNKAMMRSEYLENLGQIVGGIIHDINNLLVSILGHAQYSLQIGDMDQTKKCLEIIAKLALDGSSVTKRIKYNYKGCYGTPKDIYKFDYIVENCLDMIKHKFKPLAFDNTKNLELNVSLNSKQYIYANEYDMRHSIINIIQNGIDAMEESGIVTVRTYDKGDNIILAISDTGCGIDAKTIERVFVPYFTTKGSKGTGLGLSIAKRIFEEHGGKISVESQIGDGTKFTIRFPAMKFNEAVADKNQEMYNVN